MMVDCTEGVVLTPLLFSSRLRRGTFRTLFGYLFIFVFDDMYGQCMGNWEFGNDIRIWAKVVMARCVVSIWNSSMSIST